MSSNNSNINNNWSHILTTVNNFGGVISGNTTMSGNTSLSDNILFPIAIKVAAQTIGFDLVSVKPMSAPINQVFGYDFEIKETAKQRAERIRKERENKLKEIFGDDYEKYI